MAVKNLLMKRTILLEKVTRLMQSEISSMSPVVIQDTLDIMNNLKNDLDVMYTDLMLLEGDDTLEARMTEFNNDMNRVDVYRHQLLEANSVIAMASSSQQQTPSVADSALLPMPLSIPPFDGDEKQWDSFSDLFQAAIENSRLSDAQKLQYLKSVTKGKAAQYIAPFSITDANFAKAWEALQLRFKNTTSTIYAHIDSILQYGRIQDSADDIDKFMDTVRGACLALEALNRPIHLSDLLVRVIELKLHIDTQQAWRLSRANDSPPTYDDISSFLIHRAKALINAKTSDYQQRNYKQITSKSTNFKSEPSSSALCPPCNASHKPSFCEKFKALSIEDRRKAVRSKLLCFNCLSPGHSAKICSSSKCKQCQRNHHTLLHFSSPPASTIAMCSKTDGALLPTAMVQIKGSDNTYHMFRALLDTGSMASLITEAVVKKLNLKRKNVKKQIQCVADLGRSITSAVDVTIRSTKTDFSTNTTAMIVPNISSLLPAEPINTSKWSHIKQVPLADENFNHPGTIDILLGVGVVSDTNMPGSLPPPVDNMPWVHNSLLGWVVYGKLPQNENISTQLYTNLPAPTAQDFQQMWELEKPTIKSLNEEEEAAENHFKSTYFRRQDGAYSEKCRLQKNVI